MNPRRRRLARLRRKARSRRSLRRYSWDNIQIKVNGQTFTNVKSVNYAEKPALTRWRLSPMLLAFAALASAGFDPR